MSCAVRLVVVECALTLARQHALISEAVRECVRGDYRIVEWQWERMQTSEGVCTRVCESESAIEVEV